VLAHPKLHCMEFCPTFCLVYFIAWAWASICALSSVFSLPCNDFTQKVNPQVGNLMMWLLRTCTCSRFLKIRSSSHQCSPGLGLVLSQGIWGLLLHSATTLVTLQRGIHSFLLPLSWKHQQGNFVWLKLKTEEKGVKFVEISCFSRSDVLVCKSCLSLLCKPRVGHTKGFPACFLSSCAATVF
jgi:hypothetical protein